jgi:hypothetical protein
MAGEEKSFFIAPPHFAHCSGGGSVIFWMTSSRVAHWIH